MAPDSRPPFEPSQIRAVAFDGYGTLFDPAGRHGHLLDPRSGEAAPAGRSVSVQAAEATTADAFSTALALLPDDEIRPLAARHGLAAVHVATPSGLARLA